MVCKDEELSTIVFKFEVLYGKILEGYNRKFDFHFKIHRKDTKKNAWKATSEELVLEDGEFLLNQSNV